MPLDPAGAESPEMASEGGDLVASLRALQDDVSAKLGEKREKLSALTRATERMNELAEQLKSLQAAQLQWTAHRDEPIGDADDESPRNVVPLVVPRRREPYPQPPTDVESSIRAIGPEEWTAERESMLHDSKAVAGHLIQLAQDVEWVQTRLRADRANLQAEVDRLKQDLQRSVEQAQELRSQLSSEIGRLEQELRQRETALTAETKLRQADREEAQRQQVELDKVTKERTGLRDERTTLLSKIQSLEYDLQVRQAAHEAERDQLRDQSASLGSVLSTLRADHRQLSIDHEAALQAQNETAAKYRELQQESQAVQARFVSEKAKLRAQLQDVEKQLQADRDQLQQLRGSWHTWQNERERLLAERARMEQESQAREAAFDAERKLRQTQLDNMRRRASELESLQNTRLREEPGTSGSDASHG
jgi:DNA repair exonuclease SbcCD ATPase subunit